MVSVEPRGAARIAGKLTGRLVRGPAERLFRDAASVGRREAQQGAHGFAGISRSLMAESRGLHARIWTDHPGAPALNFGRRVGAQMPPPDALERYGAGLGFVLARAIQQRGIKGRFFMRHARERLASSEIPRLLRRMGQEISDAWRR